LSEQIEITEMGGACPVQAEGWITVDAARHPFYFRGRFGEWRFEIDGKVVIERVFGDESWSGSMEDMEVCKHIIQGVGAYLNSLGDG
jgi:hypothetical protein